jgi:hypothetical protein
MTPKEKAKELVDKYLNASFNCKDCDMPYCDMKCTNLSVNEAKQCALIAVDEIIKSNAMLPPNLNWQEVKKEIEAL